jgi:hypothetical protein
MKTFSNMSTNDLCITNLAYGFLLDNILKGGPLIFQFVHAPNEDDTPVPFELNNLEFKLHLINRIKELMSAVQTELE